MLFKIDFRRTSQCTCPKQKQSYTIKDPTRHTQIHTSARGRPITSEARIANTARNIRAAGASTAYWLTDAGVGSDIGVSPHRTS